MTVRLSPGFNVFLVQPARCSLLGAVSHPDHFVVVPSAFLTSNHTTTCGLTKSNCVTVPCSVCCLLWSNAAPPWCANAGAAIASAVMRASTNKEFRLISDFSSELFELQLAWRV